MGMSTRRSSRLAKKEGDSAPSTPSTKGGIKKSVAKAKKIVKALGSPAKSKKKSKQSAMATTTTTTSTTATAPSLSTFPHVQVKDHAGTELNTKDIAEESAFVVFLYPKANTPGCTTQACGFNDNFEELKSLGYRVYGLSYDSPKSQTNWKNKHKLPYSLLCDSVGSNSLIAQLGAHKAPKSVKRSHFFVAKGGAILDAQISITPKNSIAGAIEFAKKNPAADAKGKPDEEMKEGNDAEKPADASGKMAVAEKATDEKDTETKPAEEKEKPAEESDTIKPAVETKDDKEMADATKEDETAKEVAGEEAEEKNKAEDAEMKPVEAEEKATETEETKTAEADVKEDKDDQDTMPVEGDTKTTADTTITKATEDGAKATEEPANASAGGDDKTVNEMSKVDTTIATEGGGDVAAKPAEDDTDVKAATVVTEAVVTENSKDNNNMQEVQGGAMAIEGTTAVADA